MNKRGFTLLEMLIVVVVFGALTALTIPRLKTMFDASNTRSARVALTALVAKARAAAVARGCRSAIHFDAATSEVWVTVCKANAGGVDTLGAVEQIADRYSVTFTPTRDSITFAPSGISFDNQQTILRVSAASGQDSVLINQIGKVIP